MLGSPFLQVCMVFFGPGRGGKCAPALMGQTDGPGAEAQSFRSCAPAKIHIVEMKIEPRVEQHLLVDERGFSGSKKYPVQHLALGRKAAKNNNRLSIYLRVPRRSCNGTPLSEYVR